jgi:hypothetical protein
LGRVRHQSAARAQAVLTEWGEDHEQALAERRRDLALVKAPDLDKVGLGEVDANLLPRLTEGGVHGAVVRRLLPPAGEGDVAAPAAAAAARGRAADEQQLGDGVGVVDPVWCERAQRAE